MRNALAHVPKSQHTMVAAAIRQAFLQPDAAGAHNAWRHVADQLRPRWPKLAALMDDSEHDVLAYMTFRTSTVPSCTARMKSTRMRSTSLWCWSERAHSGNTARRSNHLQQRACDTGRPMLEVEAPDRYPTFK